ncbi:synaptotagmin-5-like [Tachypleus tridentatus]|uniref:synaptotagmin-5-like n=1 Tax=Tachypleus tridentatus TaxID=6853 RepID=UPI003FD45738
MMVVVSEDSPLLLTEGEKILVIGICLGLLSLTIIVTVCVVSPYCWFYNCLSKTNESYKRKRQKYGTCESPEKTTEFHLIPAPHYSIKAGKLPFTPEVVHNGTVKKHNTDDSNYGSMSSNSKGDATVSLYSEPSLDMSTFIGEEATNYGHIIFAVRYKVMEDRVGGQLVLTVKEVQELFSRAYGGSCDPYVVVQIFKEKGWRRTSKRHYLPLYEFRTKTWKKTQHPLFRESFAAELSKAELKDCTLRFCVFDDDRFANDTNLGEITIPLRELNMAMNGEEVLHSLDLKHSKDDNGEILFGLSYLPTAERLTFNIVKANNLHSITEDIESFAPYVRVLLIHNGKLLKKKKTSSRPGTTCPSFNESLTFDIPSTEIENIVFLIVVSHRDPQDGSVSSPESPTTPSGSTKRDRHVGKVFIGSCIRGSALHHWLAMKHAPRKQVTQWHTLQ